MIDLKHLTCSSSKLLKEANEALRKHEYQTAQRLYTEALRSGENHLLLCNRAAAYMGLNMYQEALDDSNRAIALNREWIKAYNTKALAEAKLGRPAEAFSTLTESIRLAPTNQSLLMSLRSLVLSIIPLVQEGLSEPSLHPDVLPFACYICQQVFHDPVTVLCGHSFCRACLQTCLKQDACPQCHRTLTSSIDTLKTNITLTHIIEKAFPIHASSNEKIKRVTELQQQGQFEAAVQLLEQISNTLPQYQPALIQLSNIFLDLRRYAEAETAAVRAQRVLPNNGRGQLARAAVAVATGKLSTALTLSLESYRCCPVSRRAQEFMVRCVTERILVEPQLTLGDITSCDVCYRETVLLTQQPKDSNEMMDVSYSQEPNESLSVILPDIENTKSELECQLCLNLYHEPLTTLCGHSFCQSCLMKVIEKNPKCPLCRFLLWNESYCARYPVDRSLQRICMQFFPAIYNEKTFALQKQHEQETVDVPIFVCALAFPRIPCPLHIFEPRYKLMVQRCLDSDRQRFGMCVPLPQGGYASVGVLLDIRHVQVLPNSNLLVDTIGTRRFRVIKRGARDNYNIASIEYIDDEPDDGQPDAFGHTVEDYVAQGVDFINTTAIGLTAETRQRFDNFYGRMPTDPSLFSLWLLAFLPLDDADKLRYLESTNTKDRLCRLTRVIKELQQKNTPRSCVVC